MISASCHLTLPICQQLSVLHTHTAQYLTCEQLARSYLLLWLLPLGLTKTKGLTKTSITHREQWKVCLPIGDNDDYYVCS